MEFDELRTTPEGHTVPHCCGLPVIQNSQDGATRILCTVCGRTMRDLGRQWFVEHWGAKGFGRTMTSSAMPLQMWLPIADQKWIEVKDGDPTGYVLVRRHYSARGYRKQRQRLFVGPGEKMVLVTADARAVFVWRRFISLDKRQTGVNCAVFRNEGAGLSSDLIRAADALAWERWPEENRHYTYVNPRKVRSPNPGYCFLMAGWKKWGMGLGKGHRKLIVFAIVRQLVQPSPGRGVWVCTRCTILG